jgi:hypothetical protein
MKRIVIILMALMPLVLAAQQREKGKAPLKIEKTSQTITNPPGWLFDSQRWLGWYGMLWAEYRNNDNKLAKPTRAEQATQGEMSGQQRQITSMQIKQTRIDTTKVYLLYISNDFVEYDYPYIRKSPHYYKHYCVYILSENAYNMLWNLDAGITLIPVNSAFSFNSKDNPEKNMLIRMNDPKYLSFDNNNKGFSASEYYWHVKKEDENTIRFVAPFNHKNKWDGKADFDKEYFEVSTATFNKLKIE